MHKYYEPAEIWNIFGIKSRDQYEQKYVFPGYFHEQVPKDVSEAFITVEYLLAHAYYYWPMYDEAFNKVLLVLEMAIKMRADQMNICLTYTNKKGEAYSKNISTIIKELCKSSYFEDLKNQLHWARKLRNIQMHPDRHSFSGAAANKGRNIKLFVNVLNDLFRDEAWHKNRNEQQELIKSKLQDFESSLLIVDDSEKAVLSHRFINFNHQDGLLILVCDPVIMNAYNLLTEHKLAKPITVVLKTYEIVIDQIKGVSLGGKPISITTTDRAENLSQLESYRAELNRVPQSDIHLYNSFLENDSSWSLVEAKYEYLSQLYGTKNEIINH